MACLIILLVSAVIIESHPMHKDNVVQEIFPSKQPKDKDISFDDILGVSPSTARNPQHEDTFGPTSTTQISTPLTTKLSVTEGEIFLLKPTSQNKPSKDASILIEDIFGCSNNTDCSDIKLEEIFRPPIKTRRKRQHFYSKNKLNLESRFGENDETERSHDYSKEIMGNPEYVWTTSNLDGSDEDHKGNHLEHKVASNSKPGLKQAFSSEYFWSTRHPENVKDAVSKIKDQTAWHRGPSFFNIRNPALKERSNFGEEEMENEKDAVTEKANETTEKVSLEENTTEGEVTTIQETEATEIPPKINNTQH